MKRNTFLKQSIKIGALVFLSPLGNQVTSLAAPFSNSGVFPAKDDFMKKLLTANDGQVAIIMQAVNSGNLVFSRKVGSDFSVLVASYCTPASTYYHSPFVVPVLAKLVQLLHSIQSEDGTLNFNNLESPPDTAFLLELLVPGAILLAKQQEPAAAAVNSDLKRFILKSGNAVVTGGVHTPNHRWVISAVLAQLNAYNPDQQYINRIDDWLGEGVFIDSDGHFPERSMNYGYVECNSLLTIGMLLNRPALFEPVRKNLEMTYYYMEPSGDLVTTDSRRQDQYGLKTIVPFYLLYRYMAIRDNNLFFAGIVKLIEQMDGFQEIILNRGLFRVLENPLLQKELPTAPVPSVQFEKLFTTTHLLRIRRGNTTNTLFGGVDWPIIISSGRSNSPNIYSYRKGKAILKYLRLSSDFFSMGYFYSEGLRKDGNKYVLHKKLEVPYYQPLPKNLRNAQGDYKLSPSVDGRFWNKMDFEDRPVSNVKTLDTSVTLLETNGKNELRFQVNGPAGIAVTIELCFQENGTLSGVTADSDGNSFLETGMGNYEYGGDSIQFGPGTVTQKAVKGLEGERYSTHFGTLRTEGMHVYLTGVTPFNHTLTFS